MNVTKLSKVIIVGYMRGGTSVFSNMFNIDNKSVVWFEPLDAFYVSYFGFPPFSIPLSIMYYRNNTKRSVGRLDVFLTFSSVLAAS